MWISINLRNKLQEYMESPVKIMQKYERIHTFMKTAVGSFSKFEARELDSETWSFDRAINEVFKLLPQELCPRPTEENTPAKPLSGIEHLMEFWATPLLVLPQSKLVENTTKFIQSKIDS